MSEQSPAPAGYGGAAYKVLSVRTSEDTRAQLEVLAAINERSGRDRSGDVRTDSSESKEGIDMHEIKCPHCGKTFTVDGAGYADIVKQIRDREFDKQLHERLELANQDKQKAIELAETKAASELQKAAAAKDS